MISAGISSLQLFCNKRYIDIYTYGDKKIPDGMPHIVPDDLFKKDYIEDLVVTKTKKLLTDENITKISREVVALSKSEGSTPELKHLKRLLRENGKATVNLIKAIENGQAIDVLAGQTEKRKAEKKSLEEQLEADSMQYPKPTVNAVRFFMERFKKRQFERREIPESPD